MSWTFGLTELDSIINVSINRSISELVKSFISRKQSLVAVLAAAGEQWPSCPLAFINVGKRSSRRMRQFLSATGGETEVKVI